LSYLAILSEIFIQTGFFQDLGKKLELDADDFTFFTLFDWLVT